MMAWGSSQVIDLKQCNNQLLVERGLVCWEEGDFAWAVNGRGLGEELPIRWEGYVD
jgi:hypothetical protein